MGRGITNDGRAVLVSNHSTHDYDTFLVRADQSGAAHIASGDALGISPDLAWIATTSADYKKISLTPWGMGPTRQIPNPEAIEYLSLSSWLPDSRHLVFTGKTASNPSRAYVCDVESGAAKPFGGPGGEWTLFTGPPVSPDGKLVILQDADGAFRMWPIDGGEARPIPGVRSEDQPLTFSEDGTALLVSGRSMPIQIERLNLTTGQRTPWMTMAPTDRAGLRYALASITPNGKYWALSTAKLLTDLYVVDGLH
jgi:WD40 repeat protein